MDIKSLSKKIIKRIPGFRRYYFADELYKRMHLSSNKKSFARDNWRKIKIVSCKKSKEQQLCKLLEVCDISPQNGFFFHSIDVFSVCTPQKGTIVFDNFTPNYETVIHGSIQASLMVKNAILSYLDRAIEKLKGNVLLVKRLNDLKFIFGNEANSFVDALQRVLFINQLFWQTGHTLVGFGHLDWWLIDFYSHDISKGVLDKKNAKEIIKEFLRSAHSCYEYKSNSLIGDTGQIIILGGIGSEGYRCNELTYLFIDALEELHIPDPKILLRCGAGMPDELFQIAVDSISSGIGSPLLSNDEIIIPAMVEFGYGKNDAYNYGVSACWEPLVIGKSFDNNNCATINFASPLSEAINDYQSSLCKSFEEFYELYRCCLVRQIYNTVKSAQERIYDDDPLNNLLMDYPDVEKRDFCKGGATYNNTGFTSVGISTVVNSMLNIEQFVFAKKKYTLAEIQKGCQNNFLGYENMQRDFKDSKPRFGFDAEEVLSMTNRIMNDASCELAKHKTKYGGGYKIGYSSPNYINMGYTTQATPDGRNSNTPFATHISCDYGVSYTELMNFAAGLNYDKNCFNGNVVDFMVSETLIKNSKEKFALLLKNAVGSGVFQTQVNIINSKTLIDAQKHPEQYKELIVRVWGFSAYFNDLPKDYQDNLIRRAIETEQAV